MGSSDKSILKGRMRHGRGQYFMGTGLVYMTVSALYRMTRPPLLVGGLAILGGLLSPSGVACVICVRRWATRHQRRVFRQADTHWSPRFLDVPTARLPNALADREQVGVL